MNSEGKAASHGPHQQGQCTCLPLFLSCLWCKVMLGHPLRAPKKDKVRSQAQRCCAGRAKHVPLAKCFNKKTRMHSRPVISNLTLQLAWVALPRPSMSCGLWRPSRMARRFDRSTTMQLPVFQVIHAIHPCGKRCVVGHGDKGGCEHFAQVGHEIVDVVGGFGVQIA